MRILILALMAGAMAAASALPTSSSAPQLMRTSPSHQLSSSDPLLLSSSGPRRLTSTEYRAGNLRGEERLRLRGGGAERLSPFEWLNSFSIAQQNLIGFLSVFFTVVAEVEFFGICNKRKWIPAHLSRKMTHIWTGSTMLTCFIFFPMGHSWPGRLAVTAFIMTFMVGLSIAAHIPDEDYEKMPVLLKSRIQNLVASTSRGGNRSDLVKGPLYYLVAIGLMTPLFFSSPIAVIIFSCLFLGDGLADPIGRTFGKAPALQYQVGWFSKKSIPGSLAFFVSSIVGCLAWGKLFLWSGHYDGIGFDETVYRRTSLYCSLLATFIEAISPPDIDNLLIPVGLFYLGYYLSASGQAPFLFLTKG